MRLVSMRDFFAFISEVKISGSKFIYLTLKNWKVNRYSNVFMNENYNDKL